MTFQLHVYIRSRPELFSIGSKGGDIRAVTSTFTEGGLYRLQVWFLDY